MSKDEEDISFTNLLHGVFESELLATLVLPILSFHYLPSRSVAYPTDRGLILSQKEWEQLRVKVDTFYKMFSDDAVQVVNSRARRVKGRDKVRVDIAKARSNGYIYLVRAADDSYRFGMCTNLSEKLREIKAQGSERIEVVHYFKVRNMRASCVKLQQHFEVRRTGKDKEWFRLQPEEVELVKALRDEAGKSDSEATEEAPVPDLEKRKRHDDYMGEMRKYTKVLKRAGEQSAAVYRIIEDADRVGWKDQDAWDALKEYVEDPTALGRISWMAVENFLPTYMARKEQSRNGGAQRSNAGNKADNREPLKATPAHKIGGE